MRQKRSELTMPKNNKKVNDNRKPKAFSANKDCPHKNREWMFSYGCWVCNDCLHLFNDLEG